MSSHHTGDHMTTRSAAKHFPVTCQKDSSRVLFFSPSHSNMDNSRMSSTRMSQTSLLKVKLSYFMNPDKIRKHQTELVDNSSIDSKIRMRQFKSCLNIQTGSIWIQESVEKKETIMPNVPLYYEIILTFCNLQTKQITKLINLYSVILCKTELVWRNLLTNVPALKRTV